MKLIKGQYFGIGNGDLFCKAQEVSGHRVRGTVINGAWDFVLDTKTGEMTGDARASDMFVTYSGHFPMGIGYNEACLFIRKQLGRNILLRSAYSAYYGVIGFRVRSPFLAKLRRAIHAFKRAWNYDKYDVPF